MGRVTLGGHGFHHLLPTLSNHGIEPYLATLIKPDTTSALISDTLVSCVEPPTSGWIDIILEQTYEYQNYCCGTRFTLLIMQGIRYMYKLIISYMSDIAEYKLC
jgi:hypothetical protein